MIINTYLFSEKYAHSRTDEIVYFCGIVNTGTNVISTIYDF